MIATIIIAAMIQVSTYSHPPSVKLRPEPLDNTYQKDTTGTSS